MGALIDFQKEYRENELTCKDFPPVILQTYTICACLKYSEDKQVYLIQANINSKKYILKRVSIKSNEDLEKEYTMHCTLKHIGLVPAVAFIKSGQYNYFIREYADGSTITELVEMTENGRLQDDEIIRIVLQLCQVLDYLHSQKPPVIHRDIKPDNIIITEDGICKLIDFGISRFVRDGGDRDTVFMGTEYTAPPEQYGFKQTDARSDIYSIGILMYYMAVGSLNIKEINHYEISRQIKKWILKCTEFSPKDRYESVKQFEAQIMKCSPERRKKKRIFIYIGTAAFIVLTIVSILRFNSNSKAMHNEPLISGNTIINQGKTPLQSSKSTENDYTENSTGNNTAGTEKAITSDTEESTAVKTKTNTAAVTADNSDGNAGEKENSGASVQIADKNAPYKFTSDLIEAAVRHELGKSDKESITYADLENVTELFICGSQVYDNWDEHFVYGTSQYMDEQKYTDTMLYDRQGDITSLTDIIYMKNLHTLALYKQNISDISKLQGLTHLNYLGLGTNNITDLSPVKKLEGLVTLDISGNPVHDDDMEMISNLPDLENLDLGDTQISTVSGISNMKLKKLSVYNDKLYDCDGIDAMKTLKELVISGINISMTKKGLLNIVKLPNLELLRIMGGDEFDLSLLCDLKYLNYLDICSCPVRNLSGLKGTKLQTLLFDETQVNDLSSLKEIPSLTTVGIREIPCEDFSVFNKLPNLKYVSCNRSQAEKIKDQLGDTSFTVSCPDFGK